MLDTAVIGLGWWGRQIISTLEGSSAIRVTRAFDPQVSDQAAFPGIVLAQSFDEVLADPAIGGVILATPHSMHDAQVAAVADAGKHVFCEKPLSLTAAGARKSVAACEAKGLVLGIGHERRYEPGLERIARMVADGSFGTVVTMEANFSHDRFKAVDPANWRLKSTDAPAGNMTALGIHLTDMFISLAGPVESVFARTASRVFQAPLEDSLSVLMTFESGLTATMTCLSTVPFYGRFTVMGEHAWAELREYSNVDVDEPATLMTSYVDGRREEETLDPAPTVRMNLENWADAAAGGADYRFTQRQLISNVETLEAITLSARRGEPVRIADLGGSGV